MIRRFLALVLTALILPQFAQAQVAGSEDSVLKQTISGTDITIEYSRPSVRGRDPLFGGLEKWGHVWTPGANMATTIKFSKDVKLNGTEVEAGKYGMWFHLVEAGPWELMLHADTTKGHLPSPNMSEAYVTLDIRPTHKPDFTETLTWNIEYVRAKGAILEFRWGNTLVPIELKVEPGYTFEFDEDEVAPFVGMWLKDKSMSRPADSTVAKWKAESPGNSKMIDEYLARLEKKDTIKLEYDTESRMLLIHELEADTEGNEDGFYSSALIQRGSGIFAEGYLMNGELAFAGNYSFWEFEFDENGVAQIIVERNSESDEIQSRSTRINE